MKKSALKCLVLSCATLMLAMPAAAVPSAENAALRYWRAWSMMGDEVLFSRLDHEIGKYDPDMVIRGSDGQPFEQDEGTPWKAESLLESQSFNISLLLRASMMDRSSFGVDYERGFDALMPHLSPMRFSARLLLMDADRLMSEGRPAEAAERCAAVIGMSQHLTMDPLLISSLVGFSLFDWADLWIDAHFEALDDESRAIVADAINRIDANDPFGVLAAIEHERHIFGHWLRAKLQEEWATPADFDQSMVDSNSWAPGFRSLIDPVRDATPDDYRDFLLQEIAGFERFMFQAATLWQLSDRDEEMEALFERVDTGAFGQISIVIVPPVHNVCRTETGLRERLEVLRQRVAK